MKVKLGLGFGLPIQGLGLGPGVKVSGWISNRFRRVFQGSGLGSRV